MFLDFLLIFCKYPISDYDPIIESAHTHTHRSHCLCATEMLLFLFQHYYYYTIYVSIWVLFLTRWQILLHWNHNNSFLQFPIRLSAFSFSLCKWQQYNKKEWKNPEKNNNRAKKVFPFLSPHSSCIYLLLSIHLRHLAASEAYGTIITSRKCCTAYNQYITIRIMLGFVWHCFL